MTKPKPLPSLAYLNECFYADYEMGKLFWKERPLSHFKNGSTRQIFLKRFAGKEAGTIGRFGYVVVTIDKSIYRAHRIIYKMRHGDCPELLDHIDGCVTNNRPENLRPATTSQNMANAKTPSGNYYRGVVKYKHASGWYSMIMKDGENHYLGSFKCPTLAAFAYDKASIRLHGEFGRPNFPGFFR